MPAIALLSGIPTRILRVRHGPRTRSSRKTLQSVVPLTATTRHGTPSVRPDPRTADPLGKTAQNWLIVRHEVARVE